MNRQSVGIGVLWLVSVSVTGAGWTSLVRSGRLLDVPGGQAVFVTVAVLGAPALAMAMTRRHPGEWTGILLGSTVLAAAFSACRAASLDGFAMAAGPTALVTALLPAVLIVRYPALQASRGRAAVIVAVALLTAAAGATVGAVALATEAVPSPWWVTHHPRPAGALANGLLAGHATAVCVGTVLTAALVIKQYRAGPRRARAALHPLVVPALGWTISATATAAWTLIAGVHAPRTDVQNSNAGWLFGFLPAVLVGALAAGVAWLDLAVRQPGRTSGIAPAVPPAVQAYLARALADPSIRVAYPAGTARAGFEAVEHWVDRDGRPVDLKPGGSGRAIAIIERGGVVVGLVEHDAVTAGRPDAVELVATGAGLMMETEWLTASANRDLESSRLLATRLLSAADEPRELLRGELVDGPLADLDAVAQALADGTPLADCVPQLSAITAKMRSISHGVYPEELTAGGLAKVLPAATSMRRYPAVVELTAFLVARGDPRATVDAGADSVRISTRRDPAVMVRDRVATLGGRVEPAGAGWIVEIPIAENLG